MICVSIGRTRHKMMILEHRALADQGAELVELRLDYLSRLPDLKRLIDERPTPVVVTCRRKQDRGRWRWQEDARLTLLRTAIVSGVDYVDLEDDIAGSVPRFGDTKRIVSHHNFEETPDDLEERHAAMAKLDPDIIKIVTMANSPSDCARMLELVAASEVPTLGFCMGEFGLPSRLLCGKYGAPFTYATFDGERVMAPGQLPFSQMKDLYRYDQIGEQTQVFAVLGDPIGHSLSPLLHNKAFEHHNVDAVYLPIRIPRDSFRESLEDLDWLGIRGYSVTIPHKKAAYEFADEPDGSVEKIGAANTLFKTADGLWHATNTDSKAAIDSLKAALPEGVSLRGKNTIVLGAGGAARAIVYGLLEEGAFVTIANRTNSKAETLAGELGCQFVRWEHRGKDYRDILVNCTPVGMYPDMDETPFPQNWMSENILVFDTVYNPENTLLIKQARERGCRTVSGIEMFARQAAEQFEKFTGIAPDLEHLRSTVRKTISPVNYES
ncbi:MAG: shikimate dehydrogenase [Planctomycetaceae bacterium]|nr:shikimate dehydrogenase [Planctomycetaceae bacterium]